MSVFESVKRGLEEALAYSKGQGGPVRVHQVKVPDKEK